MFLLWKNGSTGVLKISLAGANNLVPTTGLTPCIIIIHVFALTLCYILLSFFFLLYMVFIHVIVHVYTCNYSGAKKKNIDDRWHSVAP